MLSRSTNNLTTRRTTVAHEIETMAYFQATPWHGLGTPLHEDDLYDWPKTCEKASRPAWMRKAWPFFW